mmetsp:Transcript_42396/g.85784  ORF Transcript_42396/g.85784 Transcript_42396/m.85784 type:complete len:338 (-) Transcript_42396:338-1351(-)
MAATANTSSSLGERRRAVAASLVRRRRGQGRKRAVGVLRLRELRWVPELVGHHRVQRHLLAQLVRLAREDDGHVAGLGRHGHHRGPRPRLHCPVGHDGGGPQKHLGHVGHGVRQRVEPAVRAGDSRLGEPLQQAFAFEAGPRVNDHHVEGLAPRVRQEKHLLHRVRAPKRQHHVPNVPQLVHRERRDEPPRRLDAFSHEAVHFFAHLLLGFLFRQVWVQTSHHAPQKLLRVAHAHRVGPAVSQKLERPVDLFVQVSLECPPRRRLVVPHHALHGLQHGHATRVRATHRTARILQAQRDDGWMRGLERGGSAERLRSFAREGSKVGEEVFWSRWHSGS